MTRLEAVTNGMTMLMVNRNKPAATPRKGLSPAQIAWCAQRWPSFADRRVVQRVERREGR